MHQRVVAEQGRGRHAFAGGAAWSRPVLLSHKRIAFFVVVGEAAGLLRTKTAGEMIREVQGNVSLRLVLRREKWAHLPKKCGGPKVGKVFVTLQIAELVGNISISGRGQKFRENVWGGGEFFSALASPPYFSVLAPVLPLLATGTRLSEGQGDG